MATVFNPTLEDIAHAAINQKVILQGVSWEFYEQILAQYADSNALHFAYDNGTLEVEAPLSKHEAPSKILSDLVTIICGELGIDARNFGSTTFRKRAKTKGCEPDTCFYVQNEPQICGVLDIDLKHDPPPDLVIEVDVTSPSLNKLPIYAAMGVPEVWLYQGVRVVFYRLAGDGYEEISHSLALPMLDSETATEFLRAGLAESPSAWFRRVREWAAARR
jgi:Uma2 family endonuclease